MTTLSLPPSLPTAQERAHARELLVRLADAGTPVVAGELPPVVQTLLRTALLETAQGNAVQLVPVHAELGTQEAATLLGVSRPHLVTLLDTGQIPSWKVGTHRRLRLRDLQTYQQQRDTARQGALQALADLDQEMTLL